MTSKANAKIKFAYIRFNDDQNRFLTKPIEFIKHKKKDKECIKPIDKDDFDPKKFYYARWDCKRNCQEDYQHYSYYKAIIIMLGGK